MKSHVSLVRRGRFALLAMLALVSPVLRADVDPLDRALAERFSAMGEAAMFRIGPPEVTEASAAQASALLEIARRLDPEDAQIARLASDAALRIGNATRALDAVNQVRRLDPKDQFAQVRAIDLFVDSMQTAEDRMKYYRRIADTAVVPAPVRAHAAMGAYDLALTQGRDALASELLDQALAIDPTNLTALRTKHALLTATADDTARREMLAQLLLACPRDARGLITLSRELAAYGLYAKAAEFYRYGLEAAAPAGGAPAGDLIDAVASYILAGYGRFAAQIADSNVNPAFADPDAMWIRAIAVRSAGADLETTNKAISNGRMSLVSLLRELGLVARGQPSDQTPSDVLPDLAADLTAIRANRPDLVQVFTQTLRDLLSYELFFDLPVSQPAYELYSQLVGPTDTGLALIDGWRAIKSSRPDEARVKLEAAATTEPFARALLITMDQNADSARASAQDLLDANNIGARAVILAELVKSTGAAHRPLPGSDAIEALAKRVEPIVNQFFTEPRRVWLLRAKPISVSHDFGEPVLVELSMTNRSNLPLTIGPNAAIESTVTYDATIRGGGVIPAYGATQWAGPIRLDPGQSMTQIIRVDTGRLDATLRQMPTASVAFNVVLTGNAVFTPQGVVPGAGGQSAQAGSVLERRATVLSNQAAVSRILSNLKGSDAEKLLRSGEFIVAVIPLLQRAEGDGARQLLETFRTAVAEAAASASGRSKYFLDVIRAAVALDPAEMQRTANDLAGVNDVTAQVWALIAVESAPSTVRQAIAEKIEANPASPELAELAGAMKRMPDRQAAAETAPAGSAGPSATPPAAAPPARPTP